jgi:hypothetical protein
MGDWGSIPQGQSPSNTFFLWGKGGRGKEKEEKGKGRKGR